MLNIIPFDQFIVELRTLNFVSKETGNNNLAPSFETALLELIRKTAEVASRRTVSITSCSGNCNGPQMHSAAIKIKGADNIERHIFTVPILRSRIVANGNMRIAKARIENKTEISEENSFASPKKRNNREIAISNGDNAAGNRKLVDNGLVVVCANCYRILGFRFLFQIVMQERVLF